MWWILYAIGSGFSKAMVNVVSKTLLHKADEDVVGASLFIYALPLMIVSLFFLGIPELNPWFWLVAPLQAFLQQYRAILR